MANSSENIDNVDRPSINLVEIKAKLFDLIEEREILHGQIKNILQRESNLRKVLNDARNQRPG